MPTFNGLEKQKLMHGAQKHGSRKEREMQREEETYTAMLKGSWDLLGISCKRKASV